MTSSQIIKKKECINTAKMSIKQVPDNLLIRIMRQSWDGKVQMCIVSSGGAWRSSRFIQQLDAFLTPFSQSPIPKGSFAIAATAFHLFSQRQKAVCDSTCSR